ncbi:MAG: hypothetical protein D6819_05500, partial [Gammaproteobacteria bacterium]
MHFEPNRGQTAEEVKFLARGAGYGLFITPRELVLALRHGTTEAQDPKAKKTRQPSRLKNKATAKAPQGAVLRLGFIDANPSPRIEGLDPLSGRSNYFLGKDPSKWRTGIPHYRRVRVKDLWPGIDLVLYGNPQQLEYDFIVAPGADPDRIRLAVTGAEDLTVNQAGDLVLKVAGGEVVQKAPRIYQESGGKRHPVAGGYRVLD